MSCLAVTMIAAAVVFLSLLERPPWRKFARERGIRHCPARRTVTAENQTGWNLGVSNGENNGRPLPAISSESRTSLDLWFQVS